MNVVMGKSDMTHQDFVFSIVVGLYAHRVSIGEKYRMTELSEQVQSFSKTMAYMDYDKALLLQNFLDWLKSRKQDRITLRNGIVAEWDGAYDWDEEGEWIAIKVRDEVKHG
jgi:hypothetical protein